MYTKLMILYGDIGYEARGKLWRLIRRMYDVCRTAVLLEGETSTSSSVKQGGF